VGVGVGVGTMVQSPGESGTLHDSPERHELEVQQTCSSVLQKYPSGHWAALAHGAPGSRGVCVGVGVRVGVGVAVLTNPHCRVIGSQF
jgi:hypothetical protein